MHAHPPPTYPLTSPSLFFLHQQANAMATMTAMSMVYSLTQRDLMLTQNENMLHVLGANRLMLRPL